MDPRNPHALSLEHLAIGNGKKLSQGNGILRIKPRHANAERKLVRGIHFLVQQLQDAFQPMENGFAAVLCSLLSEDHEFIGEAFPGEGISIGFLHQEPRLDPAKTVLGNVEEGVAATKALLARYDEVNAKLGEDLSPEQMEKVLAVRGRLPALRYVIAFDDDARGAGVLGLEQVYTRGRAARSQRTSWQGDALKVRPEDLATLIYTSGTTGEMKGVMLTHGNIASNVTTCCNLFTFGPDDECLSFLPLSHIFERMFGHYSMFHSGVLINYAENVDTVAADMQRWRPTLMASVPRLYATISVNDQTSSRVSGGSKPSTFSSVRDAWSGSTLESSSS